MIIAIITIIKTVVTKALTAKPAPSSKVGGIECLQNTSGNQQKMDIWKSILILVKSI